MKTNLTHSYLVIIYLLYLTYLSFSVLHYCIYFLVKASLNTNWVRENSQNFIITHLEITTKTIQVGLKYKRVESINKRGGSVLVGGGKNGLRNLTQMALS